MTAALTIRTARASSGLSLRELARRAGTSHSTLAFYEHGTKVPSVATLARVVRAAGFDLDLELAPRARGMDREARGRELVDALELAELLPTRHARHLEVPPFGRTA